MAARCAWDAEERFESDIFNLERKAGHFRQNKIAHMIQKSCSEKSVLNTRDVTHTAINFSGKSKCREFVIRFKSGNQRVMNLSNA